MASVHKVFDTVERQAAHYPAANTAAVVTITPGPDETIVIDQFAYSYSAAPTGGNLLTTGLADAQIDLDITAAGVDSMYTIGGAYSAKGTAVTITLAAGGGTVVGNLFVLYHIGRG